MSVKSSFKPHACNEAAFQEWNRLASSIIWRDLGSLAPISFLMLFAAICMVYLPIQALFHYLTHDWQQVALYSFGAIVAASLLKVTSSWLLLLIVRRYSDLLELRPPGTDLYRRIISSTSMTSIFLFILWPIAVIVVTLLLPLGSVLLDGLAEDGCNGSALLTVITIVAVAGSLLYMAEVDGAIYQPLCLFGPEELDWDDRLWLELQTRRVNPWLGQTMRRKLDRANLIALLTGGASLIYALPQLMLVKYLAYCEIFGQDSGIQKFVYCPVEQAA